MLTPGDSVLSETPSLLKPRRLMKFSPLKVERHLPPRRLREDPPVRECLLERRPLPRSPHPRRRLHPRSLQECLLERRPHPRRRLHPRSLQECLLERKAAPKKSTRVSAGKKAAPKKTAAKKSAPKKTSGRTQAELMKLTLAKLKEEASRLEIPNRSDLKTKKDNAAAISKAERRGTGVAEGNARRSDAKPKPTSGRTSTGLKKKTRAELLKEAKALGLKNYSKLNVEDLRKLVSSAERTGKGISPGKAAPKRASAGKKSGGKKKAAPKKSTRVSAGKKGRP